jgi:hypothetical protein
MTQTEKIVDGLSTSVISTFGKAKDLGFEITKNQKV